MLEFNYRSISDLDRDIIAWSGRLDPAITEVVGVPRSGVMAASMLALHRHLPFTDLPGFLHGLEPWHGHRRVQSADRRVVLVVDDSVNTGRELARVRAAIEEAAVGVDRIIYGAVYATGEGAALVDSYAELVEQPRVWEWNLLHHFGVLDSACMDIDGVLCPDPTAEQNDDGEAYLDFLANAPLVYHPSWKVDALVTSRLEKYRDVTVDWLARNKVRYRHLHMLDLPSAEERRRRGAHAIFKAEVYAATDNAMFIESEPRQARQINQLTGRAVFCTRTRRYYPPVHPDESAMTTAELGEARSAAAPKLTPGRVVRAARRRLRSLFARP